MKLSEIGLVRTLSQWEIKRVNRLQLEEVFRNYTGLVDVVELHIPYTRYDLFKKVMHKASLYECKKILVLSDSLNLDLFSRYKQRSTDDSKPIDEISKLIKLLKFASKTYDSIIYLTTNHENRLAKVILDSIPDKTVASQVLGCMHTLKELFETEKLTRILYIDNWFIQIGDVMLCHVENNSSVTGSLSRDLVSYFQPRINKPFNVIVQSHTHCQSWITVDRKLVIESGALIDALDYWRDGKMKGKRKMSSIGYAQCHLKNGQAIIEDCRPRFMDWEGWL